MFELLTQILLWLLIGVIAWYILKSDPKSCSLCVTFKEYQQCSSC